MSLLPGIDILQKIYGNISSNELEKEIFEIEALYIKDNYRNSTGRFRGISHSLHHIMQCYANLKGTKWIGLMDETTRGLSEKLGAWVPAHPLITQTMIEIIKPIRSEDYYSRIRRIRYHRLDAYKGVTWGKHSRMVEEIIKYPLPWNKEQKNNILVNVRGFMHEYAKENNEWYESDLQYFNLIKHIAKTSFKDLKFYEEIRLKNEIENYLFLYSPAGFFTRILLAGEDKRIKQVIADFISRNLMIASIFNLTGKKNMAWIKIEEPVFKVKGINYQDGGSIVEVDGVEYDVDKIMSNFEKVSRGV